MILLFSRPIFVSELAACAVIALGVPKGTNMVLIVVVVLAA